ncbi:MAG: 2-oxoacid:acceptor oxidoreductase subunit alpha [Candidatus Thermoplasmatota archaeon]|jgi:2-oxoglutarate ferredoxin oxidoreductase subunit alpha|nr:2-oxoacid:acceptor oxidoreductase subunit alpha [Candidatus Thermoplasmatota archaeon]
MNDDLFTFLIAGKAGQGTKKAGIVAANFFARFKRNVFQMNDYPSLIRGGHNFSIVSTSTQKIYSHYMKADLAVLLDQRSIKIHQNHLTEHGLLVYDDAIKKQEHGIGIPITSLAKKYSTPDLIVGIAGIATLVAAIACDRSILDTIIQKEYQRNVQDNLGYAHEIYDQVFEKTPKKFILRNGTDTDPILTGAETIGLGVSAAGLDLFFAYPMTPSTPILHFLSLQGKKLGVRTIQPENEIAVANMAIGATFTGARSMVGTSGGGFCLMQEAFSLAGMAEAPVLFFLGQRPGPSTGVPTYTEQGELLHSLYPGQGEFPRIVASPGSIEEAFYLSAELLNLAWHFQTPVILLSEKHLTESSMNVNLQPDKISEVKPLQHNNGNYQRYRKTDSGISPLLFPPSKEMIKWTSYEHDENGYTTEEAEAITQMHIKRRTKQESLVQYLKENIKTVNEYGSGEPFLFTFGSTTMTVREAVLVSGLQCSVIQLIYLQPFPSWHLQKYSGHKAIIIEQNSTGQLEQLLREKCGIHPITSIRQFDGRPFDPELLAEKLKKVTA